MNESLVSIIVPVFNLEKYIDVCVKSIIDQTYRNIEIILIDDGSTDGSSDKCDYWSKKDERIKVIHKKNEGLSEARNTGIFLATGDYISFVDGDDYIGSRFVELMLKSIQESGTRISVCEVQYVYENTKISLVNTTKIQKEIYEGSEIWEKFFEGDRENDLNIACNKMYEISLFDRIQYPAGRYHEDIATTYKLLYIAGSISIVHSKLYFYYQRIGSIVRSNYSDKRCDDILWAINERMKFFEEKLPEFITKELKYEMNIVVDVFLKSHKNIKKRIRPLGAYILKKNKKEYSLSERIKLSVVLYLPLLFYMYKSMKNVIGRFVYHRYEIEERNV